MAREIVGPIIALLTFMVASPAPAQVPKPTEPSQIGEILKQAGETASAIRQIGQRIHILVEIATVQVDAGERANAQATIEKAFAVLEADPVAKKRHLAEIAILQAKMGNFDEALRTAGPSGYPTDSLGR